MHGTSTYTVPPISTHQLTIYTQHHLRTSININKRNYITTTHKYFWFASHWQCFRIIYCILFVLFGSICVIVQSLWMFFCFLSVIKVLVHLSDFLQELNIIYNIMYYFPYDCDGVMWPWWFHFENVLMWWYAVISWYESSGSAYH